MQELKSRRPSLLQVFGSVLAAAFGVQSEKNRVRDFEQGSASAFIIVGVIATILFVLTIFGVVKLVISSSGA